MILLGNWKTSITSKAITDWLEHYHAHPTIRQGLIVPMPYVKWIAEYRKAAGHDWLLGAQDVDPIAKGPVTGAITVEMLKDCDVDMVMMGHSETMRYKAFDEHDVYMRYNSVIASSMIPVVCIDDMTRIDDILSDDLPDHVYLVYEPSTAIGAEHAASVSAIEDKVAALDDVLKKRYTNRACDETVTWLYGGAVNASTIGPLAQIEKIQGFLVGRASLEMKDWRALIQCI